MDKVLYDMMDWAGIEEIVYSEAAEPGRLLGPHMTDAGFLVQAFIPNAQAVTVKITAAGRGGIFCSSHTAEESGCLYASDYL